MLKERQSWARSRQAQFVIALILLPAALASIGWIGTRSMEHRQVDLLERLSITMDGWDPRSVDQVAVRERVIIARLNTLGESTFCTGPVSLKSGRRGEMLDAVDGQLAPWRTRDEVRAALAGHPARGRYKAPDGEAMILTLAQPIPTGGVRYIVTGFPGGDWLRPASLALKCAVAGLVLILVIPLFFGRGRPS
jgi:hypothetical protein